MRSSLLIFAIFGFTLSGYAKTIHAPLNFLTIQDAINASKNGDTILVSPGTYVENLLIWKKAIFLKSIDGSDVTIIDGNQVNTTITIKNTGTLAAAIDGFTIKNGSGFLVEAGGILIEDASPEIVNNIIIENTADYGAGIKLVKSNSKIYKNVIRYNTSKGTGAGIMIKSNSSPLVENNIISDNISHNQGAGVFVYSDAFTTISNNLIENNVADFHGGGIEWSTSNSAPTGAIKGNIIRNNYSGSHGGGIFLYATGSVLLANNVITGNTAKSNGGGMLLDGETVVCNNLISGNTSLKNKAGGVFFATGNSNFYNNTVVNNSAHAFGGGVYFSLSSVVMRNTILWDNTAGLGGNELYITAVYPDIKYSDIKGGWPGNMNSDPLFVDASKGDYHLTYPSPCKDSGTLQVLDLPKVDFEGDIRVSNGSIDIGADEFHTHLYYVGDTTPGSSVELKVIDTPNTSPVILWLGSGILDPAVNLKKYGTWHLQFPLLLEAGLGTVPGPDGVLALPLTIPSNIPSPLELPFQALIGSKLSNLSVIEIE